jgi:hypothetical protein
MERRRFLGLAAAAAGWPLFIERAFADTSCEAPSKPSSRPRSRSAYPAAFERAKLRGRQLLVFVIPESDDEKDERGRAFGEWINHGSAAQVAPLALVDVVCATGRELGAARPKGPREPLMVLVDPDTRLSHSLDDTLPRYGRYDLSDEEVLARRIAILSRLLVDAVAPARTATQTSALARQAASLKQEPPPGSHWADDSGCGTRVEKTAAERRALKEAQERAMRNGMVLSSSFRGIGCGMGHVPAKSSRFLWFYSHGGDTGNSDEYILDDDT